MTTVLVIAKDSQLAQCIQSLASNHPNINFVFKSSSEIDITSKNQIELVFNETFHFDYCINCAAYTHVDKAEIEVERAFEVNVKGAANLAKVCAKNETILIHISTDYVFDGKSAIPYTENSIKNPLGVYGHTKLKGELAIIKELTEYFIIRTSWLYSEYGSNFLNTMINLANKQDEISVVGDQYGSPTYAKDLVDAIIFIIENNKKEFGIYHYSNEGVTSWFDFAKEIFKLSNKNIELNKIKTKDYQTHAVRPQFSVLDSSKFKKILNLNIPNWNESLKNAVLNLKNRIN